MAQKLLINLVAHSEKITGFGVIDIAIASKLTIPNFEFERWFLMWINSFMN